MQQSLKIIFAGTPEISKIALARMLSAGFKVDLVLTQMDRPAGRGKKISMSPVKELALEHGIEVFQPISLKKQADALEKIRSVQADILVVLAYGLILPQELLDIPRLGCVNIHVSLLPHLRGAAPIQRAIIAGDRQSGITIMQMDKGLDTGDILLQQAVDIAEYETSGSLHDRLAILGADMLIDYLNNYEKIKPVKQDNAQATYAHKIDKIEAQINYLEDAVIIEQKIRGFNPIPGCFTYLAGQRLIVWSAEVVEQNTNLPSGTIIGHTHGDILVACGNNSVLKVTELQLAGRNRQSARQFILGYGDLTGKLLGAKVE